MRKKNKRIKKIPKEYYFRINCLDWTEVLSKLGIKFQKTKRGIGIYKTRCIFHTEKTPSLIFTYHGWYHCFGCGEGGDIFRFVLIFLTGTNQNITKTCRWFKKNFGIKLPWE